MNSRLLFRKSFILLKHILKLQEAQLEEKHLKI